jgi:hypothetical protein
VNNLPREKQIEAVAALAEGVSIRAAERLIGVNRGTILSLGVRVGQGCAVLHDRLMRDLNVSRIELDEAILSYCVGKRNQDHTSAFIADLRARVLGAPEISSDGWNCYPAQSRTLLAARRYSPAQVVAVSKRRVVGRPRHISTSYVERQNLTLRMQQRRFTLSPMRSARTSKITRRRSRFMWRTITFAASTKRCASRPQCS